MLRLLGGKIQDLVLGLGLYSSSSKLEAWSDPGLPPSLDQMVFSSFFPNYLILFYDWSQFLFAAMLKKISLNKLVQIAEGSKGEDLTTRSTPTVKGIKIGRKCL